MSSVPPPSSTPDGDLVAEHLAYLGRFEAQAGAADFGAYVKHGGRLVKKLTYEEFVKRWTDFSAAHRAYDQIVERGDTMNDVLVKVLKEGAAELFVEVKL